MYKPPNHYSPNLNRSETSADGGRSDLLQALTVFNHNEMAHLLLTTTYGVIQQGMQSTNLIYLIEYAIFSVFSKIIYFKNIDVYGSLGILMFRYVIELIEQTQKVFTPCESDVRFKRYGRLKSFSIIFLANRGRAKCISNQTPKINAYSKQAVYPLSNKRLNCNHYIKWFIRYNTTCQQTCIAIKHNKRL